MPSTDAIVLLKNDHKEVKALFRQFEKLGDGSVARKGEVVARIIELLTTHTYLENTVMYPEVRKLYPGAEVPDFAYDTTSTDVLTMVYSSGRRLCALAEGLIHGAASHYGEEATITQPECMLRGASRCVLRISFRSPESRTNG